MDEVAKQRLYSRDLQSFSALYGNLQQAGLLAPAQRGWQEAAAEVAGKVKLSDAQQRTIFRLPAGTPLDTSSVAAQPRAIEAFYRMELLTLAVENLTATLANDSRQARRWLKIRHHGGIYQAKRPLDVVMHGRDYELKVLREYVR